MEHDINKIMHKLQDLPENKVTNEVIIPLFQRLGFFKVEFFGGVSEEGKDILCWDLDKFDSIKLVVAQVKHYKFSNKAADTKSFQTIVNQLVVCFKKPLNHTDGNVYYPNEAILITTHAVDTKTLLTRFGQFPDLNDRKLRVIDGIELAKLILKHTPEIIKELVGIDVEISSVLKDSLNNSILLRALGFNEKKEIKNIYTDIDFSLGKITTQLFFNATFLPTTTKLILDPKGWSRFIELCTSIKDQFPSDYISFSISKIENTFKEKEERYKAWTNDIKQVTSAIKELQKNKTELKNENAKNNAINEKIIADIKNIEIQIDTLSSKLISLEDKKPNDPAYEFEIDGKLIVQQLYSHRKWIEDTVDAINTNRPSVQEIKNFILQSKAMIDAGALIFSNHVYFSCIGVEKRVIIRNNFETTRFKLPVNYVFDTGVNLAVYGEAGAGKTTSLQMYALNSKGNENKLIICVTLANVIQNWKKGNADDTNPRIDKFQEAIALYLQSRGIKISSAQFDLELKTKPTVLLLDGIDEAIKSNPWLPRAITSLAQRYAYSQIIVTSRMSGSYIDEIPFFSITLLPFTEEQRNIFIKKWFHESDDRIVKQIQSHLKKNKLISDIVKTPLLTTTICIIAKNGIDLPNSEIRLYYERLKLLTGYYDHVKNIDSRINSNPQTLEFFAKKLAFYLHNSTKREATYEELLDKAYHYSVNLYSKKDAANAIKDLIDPCNILVPMSDDGKFGFGHLRYQEHLAAIELSSNRGLEIIPLLRNTWWHGVLTLFSQMNSDLYWLIDEVALKFRVTPVRTILIAMIKVRPKNEQKKLHEFLDTRLLQEKYESGIPETDYRKLVDKTHVNVEDFFIVEDDFDLDYEILIE